MMRRTAGIIQGLQLLSHSLPLIMWTIIRFLILKLSITIDLCIRLIMIVPPFGILALFVDVSIGLGILLNAHTTLDDIATVQNSYLLYGTDIPLLLMRTRIL